MASTKYFTEHVEIDVDLSEWTDSELIEEVKSRGYNVEQEPDLIEAEYYWNRGNKKEALILVEREYKWLRGIANLAN
jgi:hypothetical protein